MGYCPTIIILVNLKRYACVSVGDWWVEIGAIADGSTAQAQEGYARCVHLHNHLLDRH